MSDLIPRQLYGRFTKALILENPSEVLDEELRKLGIEPHRVADAPDEGELVRLLREGGHQLLFKRSRVQVSERVIEASGQLAAVMLCCIGDDSVDKAACARHGVVVCNDPVSNGRSVAELVIGELVMLSRRVFDSVIETRSSVWIKDSTARYEVLGKRLGIVGLGNIGRQVAQLARVMGMDISFYDSAEIPREVGMAMGFTPRDSLKQLLETSDFISVHVSATDAQGRSNRGLFSYDTFRSLRARPDDRPRIFLNLSRGFLIDPEDLRQAVRDGLLSYAITDVFPDEPRTSVDRAWANPYAGEPRIFSTPHIGAATREAQPRIGRYVARTTELLHKYGMLRNCVFRPRAKIQFEVPPEARHMLTVVHADKRGTKKAIDDAIYNSGANNLTSSHTDFPKYGVAYDLSALDAPLTAQQSAALVKSACDLTGDPDAVRLIRTVAVNEELHAATPSDAREAATSDS